MEEEDSGSEFQDWEVLHIHEDDDTLPQVYSSNFPDPNSRFFQVIEAGDSGSGSTITVDYFSLRDRETCAKTPLEESSNISKECLMESENGNCGENTSELGSLSGDGLLGEDELNQSHANGLAVITKRATGSEETTADAENLERRESDDAKLCGAAPVAEDEPVSARDMCSPMESEDSESHDEALDGDSADDISKEDLGGEDGEWSERTDAAIEEAEAERRRVVWWKVPFQVLRYFFLRANPAWSFSLAAAAFMAAAFLGRRFYKMKRRTKSLHLKIAVDDKKVAQFVDRAGRLNEAFSVVRRVPVVRASPTGAGANSWLAMSMR